MFISCAQQCEKCSAKYVNRVIMWFKFAIFAAFYRRSIVCISFSYGVSWEIHEKRKIRYKFSREIDAKQLRILSDLLFRFTVAIWHSNEQFVMHCPSIGTHESNYIIHTKVYICVWRNSTLTAKCSNVSYYDIARQCVSYRLRVEHQSFV